MQLTARPTTYKGTKMRSRLEALFAQHCDQAGLAWQYEPGCFADETGQYLPDFLVTENGEQTYVEVKPRKSDAVEWIDGPMRRIWASDRAASIAAMWPERRPGESMHWAWMWRNAPATTWRSICDHLPLPTWVTDDRVNFLDDEAPKFKLIRIDLVDNDEFASIYPTAKPGDRWPGSRLNMDMTDDTWRLVGPRTPTDAWFPYTIEVSNVGIITDSYAGQHFFMNDLFCKLDQVAWTKHPYG